MKALVIGATGAVGMDLMEQLIADEHFDSVDIFVRRKVEYPSKKVGVHIVTSIIRRDGQTCSAEMCSFPVWARPSKPQAARMPNGR